MFLFVLALLQQSSVRDIFRKTSLSNVGDPSADDTQIPRKSHKNKYFQFSKQLDDPLLSAKRKQQQEAISQRLAHAAVDHGTTVPTFAGPLTSINATRNHTANVIPSDPFTFGFVKIGDIAGPHGVKGELKVSTSTDVEIAEAYFHSGDLRCTSRVTYF
jgi:hypothetical protein